MIADIAGAALALFLFVVLIEICMGGPITQAVLRRLKARFKDQDGPPPIDRAG